MLERNLYVFDEDPKSSSMVSTESTPTVNGPVRPIAHSQSVSSLQLVEDGLTPLSASSTTFTFWSYPSSSSEYPGTQLVQSTALTFGQSFLYVRPSRSSGVYNDESKSTSPFAALPSTNFRSTGSADCAAEDWMRINGFVLPDRAFWESERMDGRAIVLGSVGCPAARSNKVHLEGSA